MNRMRTLAMAIGLSLLTLSVVYAQAAGGGADYNKSDRERVKQQADAQRRQADCMRTCDTSFRGQYAACGGYPPTSQASCTMNIQKNTAQCYQRCK